MWAHRKSISIHTLTWRVTQSSHWHVPSYFYFNPHPHTEDDAKTTASWTPASEFQSTSSHGGWQRNFAIVGLTMEFQSTSSHGGWPEQAGVEADEVGISIHILTRRMTRPFLPVLIGTNHFNPHPHTEDDSSTAMPEISKARFQSTSSHGGWHSWAKHETDGYVISIHILTRRMTLCRLWRPAPATDFNPHPHTEDDISSIYSDIDIDTFQSTSSHGGWRWGRCRQVASLDISIHILTRRMT